MTNLPRDAKQMYLMGVNEYDIAYKLGTSVNKIRRLVGINGNLCIDCKTRHAEYPHRKCIKCLSDGTLRGLTNPGNKNSMHVEEMPSGDHDSGPVQRKSTLP